MRRPSKKIILSAKIVLAVGLLGWVLSKAHWHNYVQTPDGQTYSVVQESPREGPNKIVISTGWGQSEIRPLSDFAPAEDGQIIRWGFRTSMKNVQPVYLGLSALGFLLSLLTVALRWWFLLRLQRIRLGLWEVTRLTFLGQFFNAVMPSTVGGDLVKAWYVAKHTDKKAAVLVSMFVDRLLGLAEMTMLAAVMLTVVLLAGLEVGGYSPGQGEWWDTLRTPVWSTAIIVVLVTGMLAFLLSQRFRRVFHLQKIYRRLPIAHHIEAAGDAARLYRRRIRQLLQAIGLTIGAHVFFVGAIWMLGLSLHIDGIPWYSYFVYVPLIYIIGAIPLTPGGVGLIEQLYVTYFVSAQGGVGASIILAMALLARLIPILLGLPGAAVAVTGPRLPRAEAIEAELAQAEAEELAHKPQPSEPTAAGE